MMMMMMMNRALIIFDTYSHLLIPFHTNPLSPKNKRIYVIRISHEMRMFPCFFSKIWGSPTKKSRSSKKRTHWKRTTHSSSTKKKNHRPPFWKFMDLELLREVHEVRLEVNLVNSWKFLGWIPFIHMPMPCILVNSHGKVENRESYMYFVRRKSVGRGPSTSGQLPWLRKAC